MSDKTLERSDEELFDAAMKTIPLRSFIRASCRLTMMSVLTDVGLREDKVWDPSEDALLEKLMEVADKQSAYINKLVEEDIAKRAVLAASGELTLKTATLVQPDDLVPMWHCSECNWRNAPSHYPFCPGCGANIIRS